jgi:hypothetical protein
MRTNLLLLLAVVVAGAVVVVLRPADAHNWVPRYNGVTWGQQCLANASPRSTPATCCEHARFYCQAACGLADVDNGWKNACRANCQSAGTACLQRVTPLPPVTLDPRKRPPATQN